MPNVKASASVTHLWNNLLKLYKKYQHLSVADLISDGDFTHNDYILEAAGLSADLSRNFINQEIIESLAALAEARGMQDNIQALFNGAEMNNTEQRAALHTALRAPQSNDSHSDVAQAKLKIKSMADSLREQSWRGSGDSTITDVVNIGIGGSDLGPRMVCSALASMDERLPRVHFVANIDPRDLELTLAELTPANTLIIISSKSFGTTETLENALTARRWLLTAIEPDALGKHVIAVSSNVDKAVEFGVDANNILPMWDWVGGRYSLWSAIGLPIAIAIGYDGFNRLLNGAHAMDNHFATADIKQNLPCMLALIEIWYVNFCDAKSVAVLPYSHELRMFPDYLQQLTMESNGKRVDKQGNSLEHRTCPTIWGSAGTIGQHSFHQLLHQGTELIPVDFILPLQSHSADNNKQAHLVANALAQSKALTEGKSQSAAKQESIDQGMSAEDAEQLAKHKASPGNRPNTIIAMEKLTPENLGALIALYEHKVFAQSVIWGINAFDQWGVELGKQLSTPIFAALSVKTKTNESNSADADPTTAYWVNRYIDTRSN